MNIKDLAQEYSDQIIAYRRYFHEHPELPLQEVETTKAIQDLLTEMDIEVETYDDFNGLVGYIRTNKPGKTVLLRADIDALPVLEKTGLPFASKNEGVMHACGHDTHTAMLLGASKILKQLQNELTGTVKLLFQSGEETARGAKYYTDHGIMDGVDAAFAMHTWGLMEAPYISIKDGSLMASCDTFTVNIKGLSSHGSAPHLGHDAIVAAASTILNIQTFVSRVNDPLNPLVVTVGEARGGQRFNIVSGDVELVGTVRTHSQAFRMTIAEQLEHIIKNTCAALGCEATLQYDMVCAPVSNDDKALNQLARDAAIKLYGEEVLKDAGRAMGSEDFSYFTENVPGVYALIGGLSAEKGYVYTNHNDKFTIDEDSLKYGSALYAQFAYDYLQGGCDK